MVKFKHIIGKSSFKQGFTIPKSIYSHISLPEKGHHRTIQLLFGKNQTVKAKFYRIDNSVGHLQVRYESNEGENFRNWLKTTFSNTWNNPKPNCNEYFEVVIVNDDLLEIKEFPLIKNNSLCFNSMITHKISENELIDDEHFIELIESMRCIQFQKSERQIYYNAEIRKELLKRNWLSEQKVVNDKRIRLKCDFRKNDFQIEVEFGNARDYYQDLVKFVMSYNAGFIKIGGLLVPSGIFSKYLCYLGHINALKKSGGRKSQYSGMMNFDKAVLEFEYIKNIFNIPFFIIEITTNNPLISRFKPDSYPPYKNFF